MNEFFGIIGWLATAIALGGVYLNNRRRRACFILWLASNAMTLAVHSYAGMWSLAVRDVAFFVLAVHGWRLWGSRKVVEYEHADRQSIGR